MIRWVVGAVASAVGVALLFLLIPGGGISLITFEVLLIVIAAATIRRAAPPHPEVDGPTGFRFRRSSKWPDPPSLPRSLRRIERLVRYSSTHAYAAHTRLIPQLRELADDTLAAHHRCDLRSDPDKAGTLLGSEAWDIVRPGLEEEIDPSGSGPSLAEIEAVVAALERLEPSR